MPLKACCALPIIIDGPFMACIPTELVYEYVLSSEGFDAMLDENSY